MVRRREAVTGFIAFVLFIYPLMYYVVVSDVRYRYPVLWLSFLAAGYLVFSAKPSRAGQVNSSRGVAESVSEQVPASADRT
jgi:hypothetical protein